MVLDPEDKALLRIQADRIIQRDIDRLLGICEFALQDGMIDQGEAASILEWLNAHSGCLDTWPANVLYDRLRTMLSDGVLDHKEQGDLLGMILQIAQPRTDSGVVVPSALPLDIPPPRLNFEGNYFCFTGIFDFGSRADCESVVSDMGGIPLSNVTKKLNYLVIGNVGSEVWRHSSFGGKIAKAVDYREKGIKIQIVSETHWASHLP